jgi:hypothetical protein
MLISTIVVAATLYFVVRSIKKLAAFQAQFGRSASEARENAFVAACLMEHPRLRLPLVITPKENADNRAKIEGCGSVKAIEVQTKKTRANLVQVC